MQHLLNGLLYSSMHKKHCCHEFRICFVDVGRRPFSLTNSVEYHTSRDANKIQAYGIWLTSKRNYSATAARGLAVLSNTFVNNTNVYSDTGPLKFATLATAKSCAIIVRRHIVAECVNNHLECAFKSHNTTMSVQLLWFHCFSSIQWWLPLWLISAAAISILS